MKKEKVLVEYSRKGVREHVCLSEHVCWHLCMFLYLHTQSLWKSQQFLTKVHQHKDSVCTWTFFNITMNTCQQYNNHGSLEKLYSYKSAAISLIKPEKNDTKSCWQSYTRKLVIKTINSSTKKCQVESIQTVWRKTQHWDSTKDHVCCTGQLYISKFTSAFPLYSTDIHFAL